MAAAEDFQALCREATCPICLEYFRDPVNITECGHNFCRECLTRSWGKKKGDGLAVSCPQCRRTTQRKNLVPVWALKNMVEIVKKLSLGDQAKDGKVDGVCQKHQEPLKLFCKDHQAPICMVCDRSKAHENHKVIPQEEAFQEYKDQICSRLEILRAEREKILMYKEDSEKESQDLLKQIEKKRQMTKAAFQQKHKFLEQQQKSRLAPIEELEKEVARRRDKHLARLCRELSSLEKLIQEMEEKSQQPASEFLQDIWKTLQRYEKKEEPFENPVAFPPELTCRIKELYDVKAVLEGVVVEFPAKVTLDPDTVSPELILSEDLKSVRCGVEEQDLPDNPERFDESPCVLGREGFTAGRHFWEVTVGWEGFWAFGVARKSIRRKGTLSLDPKEGIWFLEKRGVYKVFTYLDLTPQPQRQEARRIRVTLDCDEGQVLFSDAESGVRLCTYSGVSFRRDTLMPFFYVCNEAQLRVSS